LGKNAKQEIDAWIKRLSDEDMPVFSSTVADVTQAVNDAETSAADVAQTILRDASLTSRVLKMANSFYYNPNDQKISTISRAVMVLGFEQVLALTLSLVLIDALSKGEQRDKLIDEMALSCHAAIQAEELAHQTRCEFPENVFVATLLSRLGNMAFWAFSGDKGTELLNLIESGEMTEQEAENEVLGFSLHQLTKGLSKSWSLGELLDKSLSGKHKTDPEIAVINMGKELAEVATDGWEHNEAKKVIEQVSKYLEVSVAETKKIVYGSAKKAKDITRMYGAFDASNRINQADTITIELENDGQMQQEDEIGLYPYPDAGMQLSILKEIAEAIEENRGINVILEMVLEGIHRGVGMDRSMFAILSKDRKTLTCKYAIGDDNERLRDQFKIDISNPKNIFNLSISNKKARHIPSDPKMVEGTIARETLKMLGTPPYLIMPTIVKGKVIGMFIADRNASSRQIDDKDFVAFQQFCQQANMGLTFLSS